MDITVTEIMELADMHAHAKITEGTPAELLPRNLLQHRMQEIFTDFFILQCQLIEARREIASLQAQAQQCGAGAGCCAQAARIAELEAQLEAVGAGGVGPLGGAPAQPVAPEDSAVFDFWRADHMPQSDKSEAWAEWCALRSTRLAPQQAAQAQDDAVAQAVAVEREACAQLAAQTVCDLHIPTGVKIYGARAAKAIRARGTDAARAVYSRSMDLVRVFWQQHTQADALSMTMAELHADAERAIRAALAAPAQAEPEDLSVAYFMGLHAAKRAPHPAAPAQEARKPLARIDIIEWWRDDSELVDLDLGKLEDFTKAIRAVEAKHNIT